MAKKNLLLEYSEELAVNIAKLCSEYKKAYSINSDKLSLFIGAFKAWKQTRSSTMGNVH